MVFKQRENDQQKKKKKKYLAKTMPDSSKDNFSYLMTGMECVLQ